MNTNKKISPELESTLAQLQSEGIDVYTYTYTSDDKQEINSLYWWDDKRNRVLNIQPSSWRNERYARDRFSLGVSYIPSRENGSGCGLTQDINDIGMAGSEILEYRDRSTWVKNPNNYKSMADFLKRENNVLKFYKIEAV